jgi:hypothetical protein
MKTKTKFQTGGLLSGPIQSRDYVPLPYAQAFELSRLTELDRIQGEKDITNIIKGMSDQALLAPPGLQDEASDIVAPYISEITEGLDQVGGDPSRYTDGYSVYRRFLTDMGSNRLGSLQRAGTAYSAAKENLDKQVNQYFTSSGTSGISPQTRDYALQEALGTFEQEYNKGGSPVFSVRNLLPAQDIIGQTTDHLKNVKPSTFQTESGTLEGITGPQAIRVARNYIATDNRLRGVIEQDVNLAIASGALPLDAGFNPEDPTNEYNETFKNYLNIFSQVGGESSEVRQRAINETFRQKIIDSEIDRNAIAAAEPFVSAIIKEGDTKFRPPVIGAGIDFEVSPSKTTKELFDNNVALKNQIGKQENKLSRLTPGTADYIALQDQINSNEKALQQNQERFKNQAQQKVVAYYANLANSGIEGAKKYNEYVRGLGGENAIPNKITNILASIPTVNLKEDKGFDGPNKSRLPDNLGRLQEAFNKFPDLFDKDITEYISGLEKTKGNEKLSKNILNRARALRDEVLNIDVSKSYVLNPRPLLPTGATNDEITQLSNTLLTNYNNRGLTFVDPVSNAELSKIVKDKGGDNAKVSSIVPTVDFLRGRLLYQTTFVDKNDNILGTQMAVLGNEGADNAFVSQIANYLRSTNIAEQRAVGQTMLNNAAVTKYLQQSNIEYSNPDNIGVLENIPGLQGDQTYIERPIKIPGYDNEVFNKILKVTLGPDDHIYYILNEKGLPVSVDGINVIRAKDLNTLTQLILEGR